MIRCDLMPGGVRDATLLRGDLSLLVTASVVTAAHCLKLIVRPTIVGLEKG
jgi:hypothetical protein